MDKEKKVGRGNGYVLSRDLNPKLVPISELQTARPQQP